MNCPKLYGQHKKETQGRRDKISGKELTSPFEWCQFCFELNTFVIVKLYICVYKETRIFISTEFGAVNTLVLRIEKKFSAKALSYGFPRLDMDGVMWYDCVSLKYA